MERVRRRRGYFLLAEFNKSTCNCTCGFFPLARPESPSSNQSRAIVCHQLNARWRRNPSRTTATVIISETRQKEGVANAKKQRQTEQKEPRDLFNSAPSTIYFQLRWATRFCEISARRLLFLPMAAIRKNGRCVPPNLAGFRIYFGATLMISTHNN